MTAQNAESPKEKCGLFGVFGMRLDAARLVHSGLWALQHRGQESSGIASSDGKKIYCHKAMGLVAQVFLEKHFLDLPGSMAIGHNRYSTSGGSSENHCQPTIDRHKLVALAHNGNLPIVEKLEKFLKNIGFNTSLLNDSEMMCEAIGFYLSKGLTLGESLRKCYPLFTGAFSLLIMTKNELAAVRDSKGIRPLSIGKLQGGYVFSSETCALDTVGVKFVRDVKPGELVIVNQKRNLTSVQLALGQQRLDIFEFVYFARPDSVLLGKSVYEVRKNLGRNLAVDCRIQADVVVPVPDSAIPSAIGFAEILGIPLDHGLSKNRYIHRTFIKPAKILRESGVEMKINPLPGVLKGKRVVVVDDSIVRGTTSKRLVKKIRRAGAAEVHMVISSPPIRFPDFYGIDIPNQEDLIAANMTVLQTQRFIGADSLLYLSHQGLIDSTGLSESLFSTSCFTGDYPIDIGERRSEIKKTKFK